MTALMGIATRLRLARLFVMTASRPPRELSDLAEAVLSGGADVVGVDEDPAHTFSPGQAEAVVAAVRDAARHTQGLVAFHGQPGTAATTGADVLILPGDRASTGWARERVGRWVAIGRECNTTREVEQGVTDAAIDFLVVGPGLDLVRLAARLAPPHEPGAKPWFAAGGITVDSLDAVVRAGAMRVLVNRGIVRTPDPEGAARTMKDRLRAAWNADQRMEAVTMAAFGRSAGLTLDPYPPAPPDTDLGM